MKPYSIDWWWHMYDCAMFERHYAIIDELRYADLADWIRPRIISKIIQYERERQFPEEDPDL
jgi:hypothetical protein